MRQADACAGRLLQQLSCLRSVARAAFTVEQHHRQVVLAERMATQRSGLEVLPRLDMIAREPRRPGLQEVQVEVWQRQWLGWFDLGAGNARADKKQAAEQVAHDRSLGSR